MNTFAALFSLIPMEQLLWKRNRHQPDWDVDGEAMLGAYRRLAKGGEDISGYSYVFSTKDSKFRVYRFILHSGTQVRLVDSLREAVMFAKGGVDEQGVDAYWANR